MKDALTAIGTSARELFRKPGALALCMLLYAALLAAVYLFFSTKESTPALLALTGLLALAAPLAFFLLQAAAVHFAAAEGFGPLLRRALRDFWKLLLVSLPVVALAVLLFYLLDKLQARYPVNEAPAAATTYVPYPRTAPPRPAAWQEIVFPAVRLLLLGVVLPLLGLGLWLAVAREGLKATLRSVHRVVARALAPRSVVVYAAGLLTFGIVPYVLIFTRTQVESAWGELLIFGFRLALAFVFTLGGWLVTASALARTTLPPDAARDTLAAETPPEGEARASV